MRTLIVSIGRFAIATAFLVGGSGAAFAQDDLPGRVGRLADLGGRVYVSSEGTPEDWVEALRNGTVTSGDNLWVSEDGRAEVDYGGGQIRLAGDTNVHFARLDDRMLALFVAQGRVLVRVRYLDSGEAARVDTPNTQVALTRPGLYRIEVTADRERTTVVVREGEATATVQRGVQQVLPGQSATLEGDTPDYADVRNGFYTDGFDSWSADRDRRYERSRTASYVSRQMIGYADLDDHGVWERYPEYGPVWFPRTVASDWAPYRYGRWTWVGGWGWTWVDDAPWGYAPFHYGRWAYVGTRWGWIPGAYVARPVWSPAMVAWYGGSGWSFSATFGAPVYGWVPLAWGEPYVPWWRNCSHRCYQTYNRPYAVNYAERPSAPPTRYTNWSVPGGVTAVQGAVFTSRQPVHANLVAVRPQSIAQAPVLAGAPVLAKPGPTTIPHAKPTIAAPAPAERFIRRPIDVAPAARAPREEAVPTWGGARPSAGTTSAPPAAAVRPSPAPRAATPAYNQGTWGAPVAPTPPSGVTPPPVPPRDARHTQSAPRQEPRMSAPPAQQSRQGTPLPPQRSAPPAVAAPPAQPTVAAPPQRSAPPAVGTPSQRSAPPVVAAPAAQPARERSAPPSGGVPVAPQPRGMGPPPTAAAPPPVAPAPPPQSTRDGAGKPAAQRDGDKPTSQR